MPNRKREGGADLQQWLERGAPFSMGGDAKRMDKDVEGAMVDIAARHGGKFREDTVDFVANLKKGGCSRWTFTEGNGRWTVPPSKPSKRPCATR